MSHQVIITNKGYKDLNPVIFGYEDCKAEHSYGPAIRSYWLIHFVVSGCGIFKIRDKEYTVSKGEMFIIPPYVETYYVSDKDEPWNYIWIGFTSEIEHPFKNTDIIKSPEAHSIFNSMKKCERLSIGASSFLCARLWDLFSLLSEEKDSEPDFVEKALDCIHSQYMEKLTVSEIARRLNLDRTYFSVAFKKRTGLSPKEYLLNYRMNIAASLLKDNKKSVSVAAYSVGYSDIFNFSKMFKQKFGISPSEYVRINN